VTAVKTPDSPEQGDPARVPANHLQTMQRRTR
jgi:hypothetical protein